MHPVLVYIAAKAMTLGAYGCWRMVKKRRRERELWRRAGPLYDLGPDGSIARSEEASGQAEASGPDEACGPAGGKGAGCRDAGGGAQGMQEAQGPGREGGAG